MCIQGNDYDAEFQGSQGLLALWHSACDGTLTYSPTTSSLSALATTFDPPDCLSAESDCNVLSAATSACSATYRDVGDVQSCICQSSVLKVASLCDVGAGSCLGAPPNSTQLFSYQFCRQIKTPVTSHAATLASTMITQSPDVTSTQPASPGSISSDIATTNLSEGTVKEMLFMEAWPVMLCTIWFFI